MSVLSIGSRWPHLLRSLHFIGKVKSVDTLSIIWKVFWEKVVQIAVGALMNISINFRNCPKDECWRETGTGECRNWEGWEEGGWEDSRLEVPVPKA